MMNVQESGTRRHRMLNEISKVVIDVDDQERAKEFWRLDLVFKRLTDACLFSTKALSVRFNPLS